MGLESRCGIGMKMLRFVYSETVERIRANICTSREITAVLALKRLKGALGVLLCAFFQNKVDIVGLRRPDAKMGPAGADQLRANRVTTFQFHFSSSCFNAPAALLSAALTWHRP